MKYSHEHREIQNTLKRFIESEINPHVDEWEAAEIFPAHEVFKKMGNLGLLGLTKPETYGGAGLDYSYSMAMAEALGHIDCGGIPMAIGVQTDMATPALARFGSDELRAQFSVVIVTHSMQQAARVSQRTAFFHLGTLVEYGETSDIFTNPRAEKTKDYITGRYG